MTHTKEELIEILANQNAADQRVTDDDLDHWRIWCDTYPDDIGLHTGNWRAALDKCIGEITALKVELTEADGAFASMRRERDALSKVNQAQAREIATLRDRATYDHADVQLNEAEYSRQHGEI